MSEELTKAEEKSTSDDTKYFADCCVLEFDTNSLANPLKLWYQPVNQKVAGSILVEVSF
jgi:hypothetical protein